MAKRLRDVCALPEKRCSLNVFPQAVLRQRKRCTVTDLVLKLPNFLMSRTPARKRMLVADTEKLTFMPFRLLKKQGCFFNRFEASSDL